MVTLTFVPGPGFPRFTDGGVTLHTRQTRLNSVVDGVSRWLNSGSITIVQGPVLAVKRFGTIGDYPSPRTVVAPDETLRPFNLLRGRISARPGASRKLVSSKAGSNAFQMLDGTVLLQRISAAYGTVQDFGYWPITAADPASIYFTNIVSTADTGGPGTAWKRVSVVSVPPKSARYAALGVEYTVNSGDLTTMRPQYLKYGQVEKVVTGGDVSSYSAPREVRTSVQPERLNWDENPAFAVNANQWTGLTRTANTGSPSGFSGNVTTSAVSGTESAWTHTIPILYADTEYVVSMLVWADRTVGLTLTMLNATVLERRVPVEIGSVPVRIWVRFKTDTSGTAPVINGSFVSRGVAVACYVTAAMVEKQGQFDADYFDGTTYGSDSIWENGGTAGQTRSYYYKNRLERLAALKRLLKENVPFGLPIADPRMGVLPADIAPVGTSNLIYGSGVYGGGIYGGA